METETATKASAGSIETQGRPPTHLDGWSPAGIGSCEISVSIGRSAPRGDARPDPCRGESA